MRRVWWVFRSAVFVAALYCIFTPGGAHTLRTVRAEGCDTAVTCARSNGSNSCYCTTQTMGGGGCTGCFVPNGSTTCGTCSSGPAIAEGPGTEP